MDYKQKYLKYKEKYIKLKNQIGGVCSTCPKWGYKQHLGECWHDAFTTILLYTDDLSEQLQEILDDSNFDIDDIIEKTKQNPKWFIPINIEDTDYDYFIKNAREYILNLKLRYDNQKAEAIIIKPPKDPRLRPVKKKQLIGGVRPRRDSINESLKCSLAIYNISNINILRKNIFFYDSHGGYICHYYNILNIFNYFLLNYKKSKDDLYKILNNTFIKNINLYKYEISFDKLCNIIEDKIKKYLEMINETKSLSVNISNEYLGGHAICYFICNNIQYFYDDNGVDGENDPNPDESYDKKIKEKEKIKDDIKEAKDIINDFFQIDEPRQIEFKKNVKTQFTKFNWKDILIKSLQDILENDISELKKIQSDNIEEINNKIIQINNKLNSFYEDNKYKDENSINFIGKKYLKYFTINNISIININQINTETEYNNYLIPQTEFYNNLRSVNIILNDIMNDDKIVSDPYELIAFIRHKIVLDDAKTLKMIEDNLLEKYNQNIDKKDKIAMFILYIAYETGLFNVLKNIKYFNYVTRINSATIINFIKNPSYDDDYKLTEIQNIYNEQKNNIMIAILDLLDMYSKNIKLIKQKKLDFIEKKIDFVNKIILSDFFDVNYLIDGNSILSNLYINKNIDSIKIILQNPKINLTNNRYLYFSIQLAKDNNNIQYVKDIIEHPNFNIDEYNKLIMIPGYNEFLILDYSTLDNLNKEIFDIMLDKKIEINNLYNEMNLLDYILSFNLLPEYYYIEKIIKQPNLIINELLLQRILNYCIINDKPEIFDLLLNRDLNSDKLNELLDMLLYTDKGNVDDDKYLYYVKKIIIDLRIDVNKNYFMDKIYKYSITNNKPELFDLLLNRTDLDPIELGYFYGDLIQKKEKGEQNEYYINKLEQNPKFDKKILQQIT
jgi:hypothetical protein